MDDVLQLADLLRKRNDIDRAIASLIGRPALSGHMGEFLASRVLGVELEPSATNKGSDGRFTLGPLAGASVNVKWYPKRDGNLDIAEEGGPDYYLVLAGPRTRATSSRGDHRPLGIESVHLFEGPALVADLRSRGRRLGPAASVRAHLWAASEVYPVAASPLMPLSEAQREALGLFHVP